MSKKKTGKMITVALDELQINLFVRCALNEDRALALAELIENGDTLPPIEITSDKRVVDGRHRIEAYHLLGRKTIEAEVVNITDETELIGRAYQANLGGALPPSREDTEHTVMLLLERGASKVSIAKLLCIPANLARKYINQVQSRLNRNKLLKAAEAVTDGGLTVAKAAEQHGVDPSKLKEMLSSAKKKHRQGIPEIKRALSGTYKSLGLKNAHFLRKLLDKLEDGDVTEKQVTDIFKHIEDLQKGSGRAITDWKKRFQARNAGHVKQKLSA